MAYAVTNPYFPVAPALSNGHWQYKIDERAQIGRLPLMLFDRIVGSNQHWEPYFLPWSGSWYIRQHATVYTNVLMHHHGAIINNVFPNLNDFTPEHEVSVIDLQILFGVI